MFVLCHFYGLNMNCASASKKALCVHLRVNFKKRVCAHLGSTILGYVGAIVLCDIT